MILKHELPLEVIVIVIVRSKKTLNCCLESNVFFDIKKLRPKLRRMLLEVLDFLISLVMKFDVFFDVIFTHK